MRIVVKADEGDEIIVHAYRLSADQVMIRMELDNWSYGDATEFDWITLSAEQARHLAHSLLMATEREPYFAPEPARSKPGMGANVDRERHSRHECSRVT